MNRLISRTAALVLLVVPVAACSTFGGTRGSGDLTTVSPDVSGFTRVALLGQGEVTIDVTGTEALSIEVDDNLERYLTVEVVDGGVLELGSTEPIAPTELRYTITVESLDGVSIDGSGSVVASGVIGERFAVDIGGSGSVEAPDVAVEHANVGIDGSGSIEMSGVARRFDVGIGGSGSLDAGDLIAETATVRVSGSGSASVNVAEELEAIVDGSGSITWTGGAVLDAEVNGSGSIDEA